VTDPPEKSLCQLVISSPATFLIHQSIPSKNSPSHVKIRKFTEDALLYALTEKNANRQQRQNSLFELQKVNSINCHHINQAEPSAAHKKGHFLKMAL